MEAKIAQSKPEREDEKDEVGGGESKDEEGGGGSKDEDGGGERKDGERKRKRRRRRGSEEEDPRYLQRMANHYIDRLSARNKRDRNTE